MSQCIECGKPVEHGERWCVICTYRSVLAALQRLSVLHQLARTSNGSPVSASDLAPPLVVQMPMRWGFARAAQVSE